MKGVVFKSRGERGPECKNAEDKSAECQYKGIRDRNFNMSVNDGIKYLWEARLYVIENKYHRDPVTIERAWIVCFQKDKMNGESDLNCVKFVNCHLVTS